jgi:hypothetical protein
MKIIKSYLPFLIGLVSGLYFMNFNLMGNDLQFFPGDLGDARFNNYLLEHAHLFFTGQVDSFWNAPFMFPEENVITYSDNLLGSAPFYSILRLMGNDRETAFQLWFVLMSVFNYTACYFFLVYLFENKYAAVFGAMIFAFSVALYSQIGHAQTYPRYAIPLVFLMCLLFLKEFKPVYFFWMLLLMVYQVYCGIYLGFMLFIPVAIFLLAAVYFKRETAELMIRDKKWLIKMAVAVIINVLFLLPLMLPYMERSKETGLYPYEKIVESLPTIMSFFFSQNGTLFWDFLRETGISYPAFWDHQIFPGGIATLCLFLFLIIIGVKMIFKNSFTVFKLDTTIKLFSITALITFLLFIRFGDFSFYRIVHLIPGFGSMRALQRIINIELLFYAMAVTLIFNALVRNEKTTGLVISLIIIGAIVSDNYMDTRFAHREQKNTSIKRIDELTAKMRSFKTGSIISYEPDTVDAKVIFRHIDAMLASQKLGLKCINGYSSTSPRGYSGYWILANKPGRMAWLEVKKFPPDSVIVVH